MLESAEEGHRAAAAAVCFLQSHAGQKLVSGGADGKVVLWDWTSADRQISWTRTVPCKINALSDDAESLFVATVAGLYRLQLH